jgi:hypothetical protein
MRYQNLESKILAPPIVFFINESNLSKGPEVEIVFGDGTGIRAILDSGSGVNLLAGVEVTMLLLDSFWKAL